MALLGALCLMRSPFAAKYHFDPPMLELNLPKPTKSSIDVNNPPDEVREAAADMGVSVELYKKAYLDRPSICETTTAFYDACVQFNPDNVSKCSFYSEKKEKTYHCAKFEEKYSGQWLKY